MGNIFTSILKNITDDLTHQINYCPCCREISEGLCKVCESRLNQFGYNEIKLINEEKEDTSIPGFSLFHYSNTSEILMYKYKKNQDYGAFKALLLESYKLIEKFGIDEEFKKIDYLTFIPSSKKNIKKKGFNPSYEFSVEIAKRYKVKLLPVFENDGGKEHKLMGLSERKESSKKDIKLIKKIENKIQGKNIIIFDDIMTSGNSMKRSLELLSNNGVNKLKFITLLRRT